MTPARSTRFASIPSESLGPLLDVVGAPGTPTMSPRLGMGYPRPLSGEERSGLRTTGLFQEDSDEVRSEWAVAARVLLDPRVNLTIRLLSPEAEVQTNIQFPGPVAGGGGVAFNLRGDHYGVTWPISTGDVRTLLDEWLLRPVQSVPPQGFEALFDPSVSTAFFGSVDLLRTKKMLRGDDSFDAGELVGFLLGHEAGDGVQDLRLFATLATGRTVRADHPALAKALAKLVVAEQLGSEGGRYRAEGALAALSDPQLQVQRALHWHEVRLAESGELIVESRVVVQAGDLLLTLDAEEDGVFVRCPGGGGVREEFERRLGAVDESPEQGSAPIATGPRKELGFCGKCGTGLRPGRRFCYACGHEVRARGDG